MATLLELLEKNGNLSVESNSIQDDLKKEKDLIKESYVSSLEAILEMVENDSLNEEENSELIESIDIIFNNILDEDGDEDCECDGEDENCECDDDLDEAMLHRTSAKKRKAARRYARSAAGKKAKKIAAKKRRKYANKISRCKSKGKTFSLKKMTCVKSKTRR